MKILGHSQILNFLHTAHEQDKLAHAYLFVGPQHVGKFTVAWHLAAKFLCSGAPQDGLFGGQEKTGYDKPCNKCTSCLQLEKGIHPDYLAVKPLEDKHVISIAQIRNLLKNVYQTPSLGTKKIVIIDNAHDMTIAAANAFLKTLEEPPASSLIFLITHKPDKLPQTIVSRCQVCEFSRVNEMPQDADQKLWKMSRGLPGQYFTWLEDNKEAAKYQQEKQNFLDLAASSKGQRLKTAESWFKKGGHSAKKEEWRSRLTLWQQILRDMIMVQLNESKDAKTTAVLIDMLEEIKSGIDHNINIRANIEGFLIAMP